MNLDAILSVKTRNSLHRDTAAVIAVVLHVGERRGKLVVDYPVRILARRMSARELGGCGDTYVDDLFSIVRRLR